ncbi:hypothetical protein BN903_116 [Halorubrum sp. AJ67]|nr:hypothetical protein BN903_116 [Halorubrum sp. AJ67]
MIDTNALLPSLLVRFAHSLRKGTLRYRSVELGLDPEQWKRGWIAVAGSAGIGCLLWGVGSVGLRLVSSGSVHGVSLGALAAVGVYSGIFGLYYRIIRTLFAGTQAETDCVDART